MALDKVERLIGSIALASPGSARISTPAMRAYQFSK
jgi:hypothetical protein